MAEPAAAAPAGVAVSEQDVLLATKLHVPLCGPVLCRARAWWRRSAKGCCGGWCWCAFRQGSARRRCWPTGRGLADGRWRGLATSQGRTGSVIEIQALRAAQREQSPARVIPADYLARLGRASGRAHAEPPGRAAAAAPGLVEPLTVRETAVLRLIAAGKSNQRICPRAGGHPRHGEKACQSRLGQARGRQPDRGGHPGAGPGSDSLARHPPAASALWCRARARKIPPGGAPWG